MARLAVAVVFGWAAFAKWADRPGTRRAVEDFGVPPRWADAVAWGLPAVELAVAVAVLPSWTAVWAGVLALLLLAGFSIVIAVLLTRGRRPACSCFGAASADPIGRMSLIRNAAIATLTGLAVWGSLAHNDIPQSLSADRAVGLAAIVGFAALLGYQQLQLRRMRRQMQESSAVRTPAHGLPIGAPAPAFEANDTDGSGRHTLDKALAAGRPVLLLFLHPGCAPCAEIAAELPQWRQRLDNTVTTLIIGTDDPSSNAEWAREHRVGPMLVPDTMEIVTRYRLRGTPSAVLIDARGRIASSARVGTYAIQDLVDGLRPPR